MASGDITLEFDDRLSGTRGAKPVCGLTLEVVVADEAQEQEEELDASLHTCMNCVLTDMYLQAPAIAAGGKTIKFELLNEDGVTMYSTGDLDATGATDHPIHLQRALMGVTTVNITSGASVSGAKTFYLGLRGI